MSVSRVISSGRGGCRGSRRVDGAVDIDILAGAVLAVVNVLLAAVVEAKQEGIVHDAYQSSTKKS